MHGGVRILEPPRADGVGLETARAVANRTRFSLSRSDAGAGPDPPSSARAEEHRHHRGVVELRRRRRWASGRSRQRSRSRRPARRCPAPRAPARSRVPARVPRRNRRVTQEYRRAPSGVRPPGKLASASAMDARAPSTISSVAATVIWTVAPSGMEPRNADLRRNRDRTWSGCGGRSRASRLRRPRAGWRCGGWPSAEIAVEELDRRTPADLHGRRPARIGSPWLAGRRRASRSRHRTRSPAGRRRAGSRSPPSASVSSTNCRLTPSAGFCDRILDAPRRRRGSGRRARAPRAVRRGCPRRRPRPIAGMAMHRLGSQRRPGARLVDRSLGCAPAHPIGGRGRGPR